MPIFIFIRNPATDIIDTVVKQANQIQSTADRVNSFIGKVKGSWIGGDEDSFEREVLTRVVPETLDFMAALVGLYSNTAAAMDIMDAADTAAKGVVGGIADLANAIL